MIGPVFSIPFLPIVTLAITLTQLASYHGAVVGLERMTTLANDTATYVNMALGHSSCINHFFLSPSLQAAVNSLSIIDSGYNNSDHLPLTIVLNNCSISDQLTRHSDKSKPMQKMRWNKGQLSDYYVLTGQAL